MLWSQRRLRVVAALILILALGGPMASAGAAGFERAGRSEGPASAFAESLLSWVKSVLPWVGRSASPCDRGAGLDPNGCPGDQGDPGDGGTGQHIRPGH